MALIATALAGVTGGGTKAAFAQSANGSAAANPNVLVGLKPPPLSGPNLAGSGRANLNSYVGKPIVVVFWLNTCPHCRRDLPKINDYQRKLGKRAQIISVAINRPNVKGPKGFETPAVAAKKLRLTIPTIPFDAATLLSPSPNQWQVAQTPTAFIISSHGVITSVLEPDNRGDVTVSEIQRGLAEAGCGCTITR
jgi:thiol-disulfide isomerase/thioredoxin